MVLEEKGIRENKKETYNIECECDTKNSNATCCSGDTCCKYTPKTANSPKSKKKNIISHHVMYEESAPRSYGIPLEISNPKGTCFKHKRKVQNFLPCKTNTRGPHIGGGVTVGHSVTYEDPDAPLGHRPLMMRHHHNVEMLTKSVHYPSGYPMTRSPPHLVCNSPGPDPYRSNDNVYEELGPARTSENESELAQSDDDFAEDELSLPGERNLNKLSPENKNINSGPVSTIYHEQCSSSTNQQQINGNERNSLVNSSASNYNQRLNNKNANIGNNSNSNCNNSTPSRLGIFSGVFRNTTGRSNKNNPNNNIVQQNNRNRCQNHKTLPHNHDELNRLALAEQNCRQQSSNNQIQSDVIIPPTQLIYDDVASRNNLMQLAYNHGNNFPPTINSSNIINSSRMNNLHDQHCYNTLDSEVERRNRINQLHHTPGVIPPVATIFRGTGAERINYTSRYPQPYYTSQPNNILSLQKSRTNPRSLDRRRIIAAISADEPNYGYAEPVFHEGLLYNTKNTTNTPTNSTILRQPYQSYVLPNYSNTTTAPINSGSYRTLNNHNHYPTFNNQQYYYHPLHPQNLDQHQQQLYSRDSSFTSDSGYSHQTSSSTGNNRTNNCPNNIHDNRINNGNGKTSISSNKPINLSLPSSDSSCIGASNSNNGPNSMNCIKLQSNNCDKENSNHHHNNKTNINNIPSFSWARTRAANLNSNHINSKKCKDNNTGTALSLDLITSSNNPTMNTSKSIERINCSSSSGCSGSRIPNNSFENDSSDTERNFQIDNQKLNFNNHINNCLSSSPNNNSN
ncbi:GATA zinc finger domain-containing protein 14-like, partial [Condylostylus longicornis]|uniref:GATA zinc finger domain-containing protein 14-like n=1 Tax=Condylostylus longicornis TaxID=2530218 RepID=UPI00244E3812